MSTAITPYTSLARTPTAQTPSPGSSRPLSYTSNLKGYTNARLSWRPPKQATYPYSNTSKKPVLIPTPPMKMAITPYTSLAYTPTALSPSCWLIEQAKLMIEDQEKDLLTPFFLKAAEIGNLAMLICLKQAGAHTHAIDENGNNALHFACAHSHSTEPVSWLIKTAELHIESQGLYQRTAFLKAAEEGNLAILKHLKAAGAHTHATDEQGHNALHLACLFSTAQTLSAGSSRPLSSTSNLRDSLNAPLSWGPPHKAICPCSNTSKPPALILTPLMNRAITLYTSLARTPTAQTLSAGSSRPLSSTSNLRDSLNAPLS